MTYANPNANRAVLENGLKNPKVKSQNCGNQNPETAGIYPKTAGIYPKTAGIHAQNVPYNNNYREISRRERRGFEFVNASAKLSLRDFTMNTRPSKPATPPQGGLENCAPLLRFSDALGELLADARTANEARTSGQPRGPVTGFKSVDRAISHALATGLHAVLGNAGAGKTAFALQVATSCRFPVLYVTCEMAPAELLRRHTARATNTFLGRLKSGEMAVHNVESLTLRALAEAPDVVLLDATRAPASPQRIRECALVAKGESSGVLVVVDSLQSWAEGLAEATGAGEYETLNLGLKTLREIAFSLSCPVLYISERNREANKDSRGAGLNAGAGTRKIEYGTETVFDLDRKMDQSEDGDGEFAITLRLPKNRHGTQGVSFPMRFNGALQRFRESDKEERR